MSARRFFLDTSPGERRALGGPMLAARYAARVRSVDKTLGLAFLDLGGGAEAVAPAGRAGLIEGQAVEVEITGEARRGKTAVAAVQGPSAEPPGLVRASPSAAERLAGLAGGAAVVEGGAARQAADEAEEAVLAVEHPLPGGGSLAIEPTRALVAIDVDQGARGGQDKGRAAQQTNLTAIAEAARLLRLKGLGGLVVFDLVGAGQSGDVMLAQARKAFEPDQPGVTFGPLSRLGTLTLALPQRHAPTAERLLDADGRPSARTVAQRLIRELEREGRADPGGLLEAVCAPEVAAELRPLAAQLGPRFIVAEEVGRSRSSADIRKR